MPTACGGDDGKPPPTRAQFVAQADSVCKRFRERSRPINRRLDRTSKVRKQLGLLRQQRIYLEDSLRSLQGLGVPEADKQAVARYIRAVRKRRELGRKLERALAREDIPAARTLLHDGVSVNRAAYRAAATLGLKQCEKGKPASRRDVLDMFTPDVGVPVELTAEGTDLKLTVKAVIDPLEAGAVSPPGGTRFIGIRLVIENTGNESIDVPLAQQATLVTNRDEQLMPEFLGAGGECENSLNVASLSPGAKRRGCIPFQISKGQTAKTFQFGGGGGDTAEWDLTSAKPVSGVTPGKTAQESGQSYLDCVAESNSAAEIEACNELRSR